LRRLGIVAAGALLAACGLIALALAFNARDDPDLAAVPEGPGVLQPDHGSGHDRAASVDDEWPTSGPHRPDLVTRDRRRLTDDQILHALELGNVVILYDAPDPGSVLEALQIEVAGLFDAEVAAAGQAVILARRAGADQATALAWRRALRSADADALREFAEAWLGQGLGT
jgi:Protein of unknown function (DUF3105)